MQHPESKSVELMVHLCREDRVTVMDQETAGMIARNRFAKLLQGPGCRWMRGDVAMHDAPCPDLHQEEHIESSEPSSHHDQEIAGDDGLGMIADTSSSSAKRSSGGLVAPVREANRRGPYAEKRRYPASPTAPRPRALVPKSDFLVPSAR